MSFKNRDYECSKLFKDFRIVDFDKNMNLLSKLLWKYKNNLLPKCIDDILNNNHSSFLPQRVKAIGYNFVPKFRTCIKQSFVSNRAPLIWSDIPQSVISKKTLKCFIKHLKPLL